jgi:hypothetical protein
MKRIIGILALGTFAISYCPIMPVRTEIPVGLYCIDTNPASAVGARTAWARSGNATSVSDFQVPELPVIDVQTGKVNTVSKPRLVVTAKNGRTYECYFFDASSGQGVIKGTQVQADKPVFSWEIRNSVQQTGTATLFLAPFYKYVGVLNGELGLQFVLDISSLAGKKEITEQDIAKILDVQHVATFGKLANGEYTFTFKPLLLTPAQMHILPVDDEMHNLNPAMQPVNPAMRRVTPPNRR